jgi:hypothetical protein
MEPEAIHSLRLPYVTHYAACETQACCSVLAVTASSGPDKAKSKNAPGQRDTWLNTGH